MSNTINVNYMTRAYNQYQQKNAAKDQEKEDTRFADSVREKSEASGSIVGNSKIGSVSAKDMTMVAIKAYDHTGNGVSWSQFEWKTYDTQMTVTFEDSVKVESISKGMNVING